MVKQDLYNKSPIRLFDAATEGGLEPGKIGLITSKKGLGKTSVLVQFGMDTLLKDEQLVHVTFDIHSSNVISWYDSIFTEIAKKTAGNSLELKSDTVSKRTILNFSLDNFSVAKVVNTLKALASAGIVVKGVVLDGMDFAKVSEDDVKAVADYAAAEKKYANDEKGLYKYFSELVDVPEAEKDDYKKKSTIGNDGKMTVYGLYSHGKNLVFTKQ